MNNNSDGAASVAAFFLLALIVGPLLLWMFGDKIADIILLILAVVSVIAVGLKIEAHKPNFIFTFSILTALCTFGIGIHALFVRDSILVFFVASFLGLCTFIMGARAYQHDDSNSFKITEERVKKPIPLKSVTGPVCYEYRDNIQIVMAPFECEVVSVRVRENESVKVGDCLLILKDERRKYSLTSPCEGKIDRINVSAGKLLNKGWGMLEIKTDIKYAGSNRSF